MGAVNVLTELCQELRNWFDVERRSGTYTISGGTLTADFLQPRQFYRIKGSIFNDGVHQYGSDYLEDETFDGEVWSMAIPKAVLELAEQIEGWKAKYETADSSVMSPFQSESFGGYSYTKAGGSGTTAANTPTGWKAVFASSLNRWRKI